MKRRYPCLQRSISSTRMKDNQVWDEEKAIEDDNVNEGGSMDLGLKARDTQSMCKEVCADGLMVMLLRVAFQQVVCQECLIWMGMLIMCSQTIAQYMLKWRNGGVPIIDERAYGFPSDPRGSSKVGGRKARLFTKHEVDSRERGTGCQATDFLS
ncbi:hypothetical protein GOP47_0027575 [Adiantum capillus-veneris]|nr:hypothetical protein GOP47_0027575 [Adiantum capillus-veneris]